MNAPLHDWSRLLAIALFLWPGLTGPAVAQVPTFRWVAHSGFASYTSYATGIAIDPAGDILVTGVLYVNDGGYFLDKYSSGGASQHSVQIMSQTLGGTGGYGPMAYTSLAVDRAGNAFVTGQFGATFGGSANFGGLTIPATPTLFLEKFDTNLNRLWLATSHGQQCEAMALTVDQNGNSMVLFNANGPATLGGIAVDSAGAFLASFDPAGNCLSVGKLFTNSVALASLSATNVLASLPHDPNGVVAPQGGVASYSTNGDLLWMQPFGGSGRADISAIASDPAGNIYATGVFQRTVIEPDVTLGNVALSGSGGLFVAKFNAGGNILWVLQDSHSRGIRSYPSEASGIVADSSGNCFITGNLHADDTFGTTTLHWQSNYDWMPNMFAAGVSSDGQWLWAKQDQGSYTEGSCLALDPSGYVYVAGDAAYTANFDSIALSSGTPQKAYVARIDLPPPPTLSLAQNAGQIILSWPTNQVGFSLQSTVNLGPLAAWKDVAEVPAIVTDQYVVTNTVNAGTLFYRLKK